MSRTLRLFVAARRRTSERRRLEFRRMRAALREAVQDRSALAKRCRTATARADQLEQVVACLLTKPLERSSIRLWEDDVRAMDGTVTITDPEGSGLLLISYVPAAPSLGKPAGTNRKDTSG
ncbi:hypothetical protein [Peterkaempfera griseoplana]|uniref:hypothetical protein n=1 Tax=Peterkaempfera griseoplana TaxID=66896 RepID=UPI0006E1B8E3|nr:hypothetical protein [Peterkaempfera griseoplana]